jgi:two-component system response regulator TctD
VECADNGADADALLHTQDYALVILDLTLPRMDGLDVLKRLRARGGPRGKTPVLILTARGGLEDRVQGLNLGADDYLAKPFELAELEARVKALLRRSVGSAVVHSCGALSFDTVTRMFSYAGNPMALTPREHAVLETLITRSGRAVSKEKLFDEVFSLGDDAGIDAIDLYIHRVRKKLDIAIPTPPRSPRCAASATCCSHAPPSALRRAAQAARRTTRRVMPLLPALAHRLGLGPGAAPGSLRGSCCAGCSALCWCWSR